MVLLGWIDIGGGLRLVLGVIYGERVLGESVL